MMGLEKGPSTSSQFYVDIQFSIIFTVVLIHKLVHVTSTKGRNVRGHAFPQMLLVIIVCIRQTRSCCCIRDLS